jgi:hypothetical protein
MSRRWTLGLLSAAATTLPIARLAAATPSGAIARNLNILLGDLESARAIGRAHLAERSDQADVAVLLRELADSGMPIEAPIQRGRLAPHRLRVQIRQDFAGERIGIVDGWRLSLTELRLCALAALVH